MFDISICPSESKNTDPLNDALLINPKRLIDFGFKAKNTKRVRKGYGYL